MAQRISQTEKEKLWRDYALPSTPEERLRRRNAIVMAYMELVHTAVNRFRPRADERDDYTQVGAIALIGAVERFDPSRGKPFASLAIPTIEGKIKHYRRGGPSVDASRLASEVTAAYYRAERYFTEKHSRQPTPKQLADYVGCSVSAVQAAKTCGQSRLLPSFDAPIGNAEVMDHLTLADKVADNGPHPGLCVDFLALRIAIDKLTEKYLRDVMLYRVMEYTQDEVAAALGISQMHVSRLQRKALRQLRAMMLDADPAIPGADTSNTQESKPISSGNPAVPYINEFVACVAAKHPSQKGRRKIAANASASA